MAKRKVRIYKDPNGKGEYRSNLKNFLFLAQAGGAPQQAAPQQGGQQQGMSPAEQEQLYNYVYDSLDIDQADPQMLFETLTKQGMDPNLVKTIIELSIKRITEGRSSADSEKALAQAEIEREEALAERKRLEQEQQEAAAAEEQLLVDEMNQDSSMSEGVNEDDQVDEMIEAMDDNQEEVVEETVEEDIPDSQSGGEPKTGTWENPQNIDETVINRSLEGAPTEISKEAKKIARGRQLKDLATSIFKTNPNMTEEEFYEKFSRVPEYKNLTLDQLQNFFKNRDLFRRQAQDELDRRAEQYRIWDKYHDAQGKLKGIDTGQWNRIYRAKNLIEIDPRTARGFGPNASYDGEAAYRIWKANPFSALLRGAFTGDSSYRESDLERGLMGAMQDQVGNIPLVGSTLSGLFPDNWVDQTKLAASVASSGPMFTGPGALPSAIAFGTIGAADLGMQAYDKIKNFDTDFDYERAAQNAMVLFPFGRWGKKGKPKVKGKKSKKGAKDGIEDYSYLDEMTSGDPSKSSGLSDYGYLDEMVGTTTGKTTSTSTGNKRRGFGFMGMKGEPVPVNTSKIKKFKDLSPAAKLWRIGKWPLGAAGLYAADQFLTPFTERKEAPIQKEPFTPEQQKLQDMPTDVPSYTGDDLEGEMQKEFPNLSPAKIKSIIRTFKRRGTLQQLRDNMYKGEQWLDENAQAPSSSPLPMKTMAQRGGVISKKQYVKQGMKNFEAGGQEINNATPWNVNNETGTREAQKNILVNYAQTNVAKDQEKKRLEAEYDAMMAQQQQMYNPPMGEEIIDMTNMQEEMPSAQFGGGRQRRMLRRATRPMRQMMRRGMIMPGVSKINVTKSGIFGPKEYSMTMNPAYSGLMGMMGNPMMMMQGMLSNMGMPYQYTVPFITQSNKANTTTKAEKEVQMRNSIPDIEAEGRMASDYAGHDPVIGETLQAYFARTGRGGDEYMEAFSEEDMTKTWSGDDWKLPGAQFGGFTDQESGLTKFVYGGDEDMYEEGGSYNNPGFKALPLSVQQKIMQQQDGGELDEYQKAGATQYTVSGADVGPNAKRPIVDYTQQQAGDPRLDPALGMMSPTQEVQDQRAKEQQRVSSNNRNFVNPNPNSRVSPEQMKMMQQQLMQNYQNSMMRGMRYPSMGRGRNLFGNFMSANPAFSYAGSYAQPIYNKRSGSPFMGMVPPGANLQKIDVTKSGIFGRPKKWSLTYGTGAPKLYGVDDDGNRVSSEEQDTRSRAERKTDNLLNRKERRAENKYERNRRRAMKKGVGDGMLSYREQKAEEAEIARQEELDYQNAIDNFQEEDEATVDREIAELDRDNEPMELEELNADFEKEKEADRNAAMADIDQRMKFGKTGNFGSAATGKSYNAFPPSRITTPVNVKGQSRGERVLMDGSDATTFNPMGTGIPTLQNRNPEVPFNTNMLQNQRVGPMGTDDNTGIYEGEGNPFIQAMGNPGSMAYGGPMIDDEVEMTEEEIRMFVMGGGVVEYI
tara:strand:- start:6547 stop:10983 length:4437 start_codon:yes stop_codon:yes gene_type:complete